MNRRTFLAASAATVSTGPLLLGMTRKAGSEHPVVGDGYYTRHADVRRGPHVTRISLRAVSTDHRGASFPALSAVTRRRAR